MFHFHFLRFRHGYLYIVDGVKIALFGLIFFLVAKRSFVLKLTRPHHDKEYPNNRQKNSGPEKRR